MASTINFERFSKVTFHFDGPDSKFFEASFLDTDYMPIFAAVSWHSDKMSDHICHPEAWATVSGLTEAKTGRADIWVGCMCTKVYVELLEHSVDENMREIYVIVGRGRGPSEYPGASMKVTLHTHPDVERLSARYSELSKQARSLDKEIHEVETTLMRLRTAK